MNYQFERTKNGMILRYAGLMHSRLYEIVPGIILGYHQVKTESLPMMDLGSMKCLLTINHVRKGICELKTDENNYVYVKGNNLCISGEWASAGFHYPSGSYEGLEIYFMDGFQKDETGFLKKFGIDFEQICTNYLSKNQNTFITNASDLLQDPVDSIYALFDREAADIFLLRLYTLLILRMLTAALPSILPAHISFLTPAQLAMVQKAQRQLTGHLDERIPVWKLADEMGISETSLKNYFRAVYGQNISEYLLDKRMEYAKKMLKETSQPIGEIAAMAGYQNASRFSAAFQKYAGCTPSLWRKKCTVSRSDLIISPAGSKG